MKTASTTEPRPFRTRFYCARKKNQQQKTNKQTKSNKLSVNRI